MFFLFRRKVIDFIILKQILLYKSHSPALYQLFYRIIQIILNFTVRSTWSVGRYNLARFIKKHKTRDPIYLIFLTQIRLHTISSYKLPPFRFIRFQFILPFGNVVIQRNTDKFNIRIACIMFHQRFHMRNLSTTRTTPCSHTSR